MGAALALAVAVAACAPLAPANARAMIYDADTGAFVDEAALVAAIAPVRYRLLGEVHDNPAPHRLRAALIRDIAATGRAPAVVLEQFDLPEDAAIAHAQAAGADADALATAGHLDRKGWKWPLHEPILAAALALHLPVHAANLPSSALRPVLEGAGDAALPALWRSELEAGRWSAAQESALEAEIRDSHCNALPDALVPHFARAQRMRDAAMAGALARDATADGAILIAGNGHVRRDRGVPAYLPPGTSISVGFVELAAGADALATARDAAAEFDYVWLVPEIARPDPCAKLRLPAHRDGAAR